MNALPLTCSICETQFPTLDDFIQHVKSYHNSELARFNCVFEDCMLVFTSGYRLKRHLENHFSKGMNEHSLKLC